MLDINDIWGRFSTAHGDEYPEWTLDELHDFLGDEHPDWMHSGPDDIERIVIDALDAEIEARLPTLAGWRNGPPHLIEERERCR